jgi:hypothetical protein
VNKRHQTTTCTHTWRLVDEACTFVLQFREGRVNVFYLNGNMVHAGTALREKLAYSRFRAQWLQQFDVSLADCQHANFNALFGDFLGRVNLQPERISPDCQTFFDAFCRYSDVINFQQPE